MLGSDHMFMWQRWRCSCGDVRPGDGGRGSSAEMERARGAAPPVCSEPRARSHHGDRAARGVRGREQRSPESTSRTSSRQLVAPPGASLDAAVVTAAHRALTNYLPDASAAMLDRRCVTSTLAAIPGWSDAKTEGIATRSGRGQRDHCAARRTARSPSPTAVDAGHPRAWQADGTSSRPAALRLACSTNWPAVTPFGVPDALLPTSCLRHRRSRATSYRKAYEELDNGWCGQGERSSVPRIVSPTWPGSTPPPSPEPPWRAWPPGRLRPPRGCHSSESSTRARVDHDGRERRPHRLDVQQVPVHDDWRPETGHPSAGRRGRQRQDVTAIRGFATFIADALPARAIRRITPAPRAPGSRRCGGSSGPRATTSRSRGPRPGPRLAPGDRRHAALHKARARSPTTWTTPASTAASTGASTRWLAARWDARSRPTWSRNNLPAAPSVGTSGREPGEAGDTTGRRPTSRTRSPISRCFICPIVLIAPQ